MEDAVFEVRDLEAAVGRGVTPPRTPKAPPDVVARQRALGAVYAALVASHTEVQAIRGRVGDRSDTRHPEPVLLTLGEVASWVTVHYMRTLRIDTLDQATDAVRMRHHRGDAFETLYFPSPHGSGRAVSIPARSLLGDLAVCSAKLAGTYRWWPVDATRVILTGKARPVVRSNATLDVRYGWRDQTSLSATTRITLELDPEMHPEEVQAAYLAARSLIMPPNRERVRPLTPKAAELAAWVATRPRESWARRMNAWNRTHSQWTHSGPASNFARDALSAYRRLTDPGWILPGGGESAVQLEGTA